MATECYTNFSDTNQTYRRPAQAHGGLVSHINGSITIDECKAIAPRLKHSESMEVNVGDKFYADVRMQPTAVNRYASTVQNFASCDNWVSKSQQQHYHYEADCKHKDEHASRGYGNSRGYDKHILTGIGGWMQTPEGAWTQYPTEIDAGEHLEDVTGSS